MVLIDVTRLLDRALQGKLPTGVDRVGLAYVAHFRNRARALVRFAARWVALGTADSLRLFDLLLEPGADFAWCVRWLVGRGWLLAWNVPRGAVLFNTGHSGLDRADYALRAGRFDLRPIFFLHDLIPITHPEYGRPGEEVKHRARLETMLTAGAGIVVNSEDTLRELKAYSEARGCALPPCAVAPLAPPQLSIRPAPPPLARPYFVVLGTIEPRKNHLLLLHLWRELSSRMGGEAPRLVVIGQRGWECEQVVDLLDRCAGLRECVIELPRCTDAELGVWLAHARALLFPSFVEGYGIPLVEALSLGMPVIASDLEVFREIAGDIPDYLDPLDGLGWRGAILDFAQPDSSRRRAQVARMAGYVVPSWAAHFRQVEALMRELDG